MVEFADFNHRPKETPMTDADMPLIKLLQMHGRAMRSTGISCAQ
jgi:hypothetical protein